MKYLLQKGRPAVQPVGLPTLARRLALVLAFAAAGIGNQAMAQQSEGLQLPEDLQVSEEPQENTAPPKYSIEEGRVGNRLERITVRRSNGIDEIYENTEVDSMWLTEDKELGQTQNVRRWTIGSW